MILLSAKFTRHLEVIDIVIIQYHYPKIVLGEYAILILITQGKKLKPKILSGFSIVKKIIKKLSSNNPTFLTFQILLRYSVADNNSNIHLPSLFLGFYHLSFIIWLSFHFPCFSFFQLIGSFISGFLFHSSLLLNSLLTSLAIVKVIHLLFWTP